MDLKIDKNGNIETAKGEALDLLCRYIPVSSDDYALKSLRDSMKVDVCKNTRTVTIETFLPAVNSYISTEDDIKWYITDMFDYVKTVLVNKRPDLCRADVYVEGHGDFYISHKKRNDIQAVINYIVPIGVLVNIIVY